MSDVFYEDSQEMKKWIYKYLIYKLFSEFIDYSTVRNEVLTLSIASDLTLTKKALAIDITKHLLDTKAIKVSDKLEIISGIAVRRVIAEIKVYKPY